MPPFHRAPHHRLRETACILAVILMGGCASAPAVTSAKGRVVDVHGRPVGGAHITVKTHSMEVLGTGVTEPDGGFSVTLARHRQNGDEPELSVEADGFMRWSQWADWEQLVDYPVRLDRKVDAGYLTALRTVSDPAERISRMEEILSLEEWNWTIETLFPFLGELREDLLAASARPTRTALGFPLSDRALLLLAYWDDPRDRALLAPWRAEHRWFAAPPSPVQAPSPEALCSAWADVYFTQYEGFIPPRWLYDCTQAVVDPTQTRAVMFFQVDDGHLPYNMDLVLWRDGKDGPWQLHSVVEGMRDDLFY